MLSSVRASAEVRVFFLCNFGYSLFAYCEKEIRKCGENKQKEKKSKCTHRERMLLVFHSVSKISVIQNEIFNFFILESFSKYIGQLNLD
jgi:hypothetical protein